MRTEVNNRDTALSGPPTSTLGSNKQTVLALYELALNEKDFNRAATLRGRQTDLAENDFVIAHVQVSRPRAARLGDRGHLHDLFDYDHAQIAEVIGKAKTTSVSWPPAPDTAATNP